MDQHSTPSYLIIVAIKKALTMYFGQYNVSQFLTEEDWQFCREVEAVLVILTDVSTLAQNESNLNPAFGPIMKKVMHKRLKSNLVDMIDVDQWGAV